MDIFHIGGDQTCWVFISDSNERRHVYDVVHAIHILQSRGVGNNAIKFFTDDETAALHFYPYVSDIPLLPIADMSAILANLKDYKSVVVTITGHGGPSGIGDPNILISPNSLLSDVRAIEGLEVAALIVCQCYAGVFNFVDASSQPHMALMGATNLNVSASLSVNLTTPISEILPATGVLHSWSANIFMFYFFQWLSSPTDVDGDGTTSLLDGYKYAGVATAQSLSMLKSNSFLEAQDISAKIAHGMGPNHPLFAPTLRAELERHVIIYTLNQEPWLLHANLARNIII